MALLNRLLSLEQMSPTVASNLCCLGIYAWYAQFYLSYYKTEQHNALPL